MKVLILEIHPGSEYLHEIFVVQKRMYKLEENKRSNFIT